MFFHSFYICELLYNTAHASDKRVMTVMRAKNAALHVLLRVRVAVEGKGPQRRPQKRLDGWLEEVAKAVGGGYCRLRMPLRPALAIRETVAGDRLGALKGGGGVTSPLPMYPCPPLPWSFGGSSPLLGQWRLGAFL